MAQRRGFQQAGINPLDQAYTAGFDGGAKIKRSDFGINYRLPTFGDEATVNPETEFKPQPQG